jgi:hypothetical protein
VAVEVAVKRQFSVEARALVEPVVWAAPLQVESVVVEVAVQGQFSVEALVLVEPVAWGVPLRAETWELAVEA